jgi:AcrR family transcriptional regulator
MARRTKEDALATRELLLDAAERVFHRRGVSRTTLQEIAQDAGLTRGAIYWHFQNKGELFHAMMERVTLPIRLHRDRHAPQHGVARQRVAQLVIQQGVQVGAGALGRHAQLCAPGGHGPSRAAG